MVAFPSVVETGRMRGTRSGSLTAYDYCVGLLSCWGLVRMARSIVKFRETERVGTMFVRGSVLWFGRAWQCPGKCRDNFDHFLGTATFKNVPSLNPLSK